MYQNAVLLLGSGFASATQSMHPLLLQLNYSPIEIWRTLSWLGKGVVLTLLLMSIYSIAVMVERYLTFRAAATQSRLFAPQAAKLFRTAQLDDALTLSQQYRRSHLAAVVNSGLQELAATNSAKFQLNQAGRMRKAKRAVKRATALKQAELQRGLSALATIGSTAPFVGLFGTVIGIINCFELMNNNDGATGFAAISSGIAEALVTTAFGLLVAIPAVWMFNYFTNRLHCFAVEMNNSADELVDYFLQQDAPVNH